MDIRLSVNPMYCRVSIYLTETIDGIIYVCHPERNSSTMHRVPVNTGMEVEPSLVIPGWPDEVLKQLADAIAKLGVKPDADAKLEGELKATKYHLEDMRKIALE